MKSLIKRVLPLSWRRLILRSLNYFPQRHALTLPPPLSADGPPAKLALVSYVTAPFQPQGAGSTLFTHAGVPKLMVQALHEMGYAVDLIEWNNTVFRPRKEYHLFIGHAGRNFERLADRLSRECTKIYFSTGTYWREHNRREEQRFAALEQRRGRRLPPDRRIIDSEERANEIADGIICLGNRVAQESYGKFPLVLHLNNATYPAKTGQLRGKDHSAGRANFLFLASAGNVHKGLDLLLEAFSQPPLLHTVHLYICQEIRLDFRALYRHELEDLPNIHLVGHLDLQSARFHELAGICSFMIHPSCAEGQPGAVLDCLRHGLIPILTRENNMDIEEYGVTISDSIQEIAEKVIELSCLPVEDCRRLAARAQEAAATEYTEAAFFRNIQNSIQTIADSQAGHRKNGQEEADLPQ